MEADVGRECMIRRGEGDREKGKGQEGKEHEWRADDEWGKMGGRSFIKWWRGRTPALESSTEPKGRRRILLALAGTLMSWDCYSKALYK